MSLRNRIGKLEETRTKSDWVHERLMEAVKESERKKSRLLRAVPPDLREAVEEAMDGLDGEPVTVLPEHGSGFAGMVRARIQAYIHRRGQRRLAGIRQLADVDWEDHWHRDPDSLPDDYQIPRALVSFLLTDGRVWFLGQCCADCGITLPSWSEPPYNPPPFDRCPGCYPANAEGQP